MNKADRIKVEKWIKENIGMDSHEIREFRGVRLADLLQLYADEQSREDKKFIAHLVRKNEALLQGMIPDDESNQEGER